MKLQIRTLSVQERKELYTEALEYFSTPVHERRRVNISTIHGVCEFLCKIFIPEVMCKVTYETFYSRPEVHNMLVCLFDTSHAVLPELYRKRKETLDLYWFNDDQERIAALQACIEDTSHITEEDDEQGVKVYAEFDTDWEPQA